MSEEIIFYRRHLPHYQPPGAILFVTFRLYRSLPVSVMRRLIQEAEMLEKAITNSDPKERAHLLLEAQKKMFAQWDLALAQQKTGPAWLARREVAQVVADALHYLDGKKYELIAYCIIVNHVHVMFKPSIKTLTSEDMQYYTLREIMQSLKGFTAWKANRLLNRTGPFWQRESYDHVVRDEHELRNVIRYVIMNPVKAGLVDSPELWEWSYFKGGIEAV